MGRKCQCPGLSLPSVRVAPEATHYLRFRRSVPGRSGSSIPISRLPERFPIASKGMTTE